MAIVLVVGSKTARVILVGCCLPLACAGCCNVGQPRCGMVCGDCRPLRLVHEPCRIGCPVWHAAAAIQPVSQDHSRFHPVPTRPVFSPRGCPLPGVFEASVPVESVAPPPPIEGSPQPINIQVPAPLPEEIPAPKSSPRKEDRVTQALGRPAVAWRSSQGPSWIFSTSTPCADPPIYRAAQSPAEQEGPTVRR